jgi:hypothetical protein
MPDRFHDAQWYVAGGDSHRSIIDAMICDASDPDGAGPNGHAIVCRSVVKEDALLIAAAPDLLAACQSILAGVDFGLFDGESQDADWYKNQVQAAVSKAIAETRDEPIPFFDHCATGAHGCFNDDQVCACWCEDCIDLTEPRCDRCSTVLENGVCPDAPDCVEG